MLRRGLLLTALGLVVACGGGGGDADAGHVGPGESCTEIVEHCHSVDTGVGEIAECHALGHDGPAEMCDARVAECVALCDAADVDGGPPDACDMLGHQCHPFDTGSGPAHDCHELGHAGDLAACEAMLASCLMTCSGDAGSAHDEDAGAAHDHDGGATDDGGHAH